MPANKTIILVTGGAGFIGSHLCERLINDGHAVRCIDDLSYGSYKNLAPVINNPDFEFVETDVCDLDAVKDAVKDVSTVYHLAARKIPRYGDALSTLVVNNEGAKNVLGACMDDKIKVVLASTSDVYGKGEPPFKETDNLVIGPSQSRRWSYAVSKIFDEHMALACYGEGQLPVVILRFFGSYGPRHHRSWWGGPQSVFIDQVLSDSELTIHGDGKQTRSFTYIDDLINGIVTAGENPKAVGEIFNLGSDDECTILRLAETINEIIRGDKKANIKFIPYESFGGNYEDVRRRIPDLAKAKELLGFEWKTSLKDGLTKTVEWHKSNQ